MPLSVIRPGCRGIIYLFLPPLGVDLIGGGNEKGQTLANIAVLVLPFEGPGAKDKEDAYVKVVSQLKNVWYPVVGRKQEMPVVSRAEYCTLSDTGAGATYDQFFESDLIGGWALLANDLS